VQKFVGAGAVGIAIIATGATQAAPASAIRTAVASDGIVSVVRERDLCHGKRVGTRACYNCCRTHGLSASRCLRNCRMD